VVSTTSGYAGGSVVNPSYEQVSAGVTGHTEVVQVVFDPEKTSYERLLEVFWTNIDPFDGGGQFCDRGSQYRTAIFYADEAQKRAAQASKDAIEKSAKLPGSIVTEITPLDAFYPAEDYHQDYYKKNVRHYQRYRKGCGRDRRLQELWGKSDH
jgi:peptide-methionine (S)-S-oxide reductase